MHRILCIPRKLLETCRLRVRFCPAGIGRRLQRGGKQQKRRLAKSLTAHDCRDRHNSIGADYAESVHNSGYKLLNSGLRLPVAGGTDSFSDVPRDPPLGTARTYVRIDGPLTYRKWIQALKAGRSFATNGPLLKLNVNDREIGGELAFDEPATVHVEAKVMSNVPIQSLEIVVNGKIVKSTGTLSISMELPVERSSWIAARVLGPAHPLVGDSYAFAHTSPIYIRIGESRFGNDQEAEFFIQYIQELKAYLQELPWKNRERLRTYLDAYDRAIEVYRSR